MINTRAREMRQVTDVAIGNGAGCNIGDSTARLARLVDPSRQRLQVRSQNSQLLGYPHGFVEFGLQTGHLSIRG